VVALPLLGILAIGRTLAWRDSTRLFGPVRTLVVEALAGFRLPLWNPYEGFGIPLFAQTMHGVLHPLSVAAAFIVGGAGLDVLIVGHTLLAALGAYVLARELGAAPAASAVAGLGFGLSGYVLSMSGVLMYLSGAGAAPWTLAALHLAGRGGRLGVAAGAVAVAIQVFAGDPQWLVVACALGIGMAWVNQGRKGLARSVGAVALGAVLAAIQLVPSFVYFRGADRSTGLSEIDRVQWALAPARLLEFLLPGLFFGRPGEPAAPVFQWLGGPSEYQTPFVTSVFVGSVLLWLAAFGVRADRVTRFLALAAGFFLWVALGPRLGATQLLAAVPVWGAFRYSEKLVGPFTLCVALLAAFGAQRVVPTPRKSLYSALVAVVLGLLCALSAWGGTEDLLRAAGAGPFAAEARHRLAVGLGQSAAVVGLLALALGFVQNRTRGGWFPALAAGLVATGSIGGAIFALHAGQSIGRDDTILGPVRKADPFARIATPAPAGYGPAGLDHWDRVTWAESRMGLPSYAVAARVGNVDAYSGVLPLRYLGIGAALGAGFGDQGLVAMRRLGLSHVVVGPIWDGKVAARARAAIEGGRLVHSDPTWGVEVWEVPRRPWASFAPGASSVASREDAARLLVKALEDGSQAVVLEGAPPSGFGPGKIIALERGHDRVRVEAESDGPGLMVVNDAWDPGWRATLDGEPVEVLPADGVVRAVRWPGGRHVLAMTYDPVEVRVGMWLSLLGLGMLAVVIAQSRRRGGRAP
jgi:hypothetical protein